jgi:hypothetical protein
MGAMNEEVAVINGRNSDRTLSSPNLLQRLGDSSRFRSSVRWVVEWNGDACAPKEIYEARRHEGRDMDWHEVISSIELAAGAVGEARGCIVAIGYPEEWHVSLVEDGVPWITVALDRSYELASIFSA